MTQTPATSSQSDLARAPISAFSWWGLPILIGLVAGFFVRQQRADAALWTALLAWMSVGCALNAARCHRLHCYISSPVLGLAAMVSLLIALGWLDLGRQGLNLLLGAATFGVGVSFLPELAGRRYLD